MPGTSSRVGRLVRRLTWVAAVCSGLWLLVSLVLATDGGRSRMDSAVMQTDSIPLLLVGVQMMFWASLIAWGGVVGGWLVLANRADQMADDATPAGEDWYA